MSNALTITAKPEDLARVETIVLEMSAAGGMGDGGHFGRAFRMAAAINALHRAITPEMLKDIMHLQGTGLGFLTDKDSGTGYDEKTVKLVAIEAALMGAHWVGNEFNIISARPYLTKNFFTRKLREFPGLTDLKLSPGVPVLMGDKGALVPYVATWKLNGVEMRIERLVTKLDDKRELDERICVKVNSGMGADAILGKAERKIKAAIYARLTGSDLTDGEVDDSAGAAKPVNSLNDLTARLEQKQNGNGNGLARGEIPNDDAPSQSVTQRPETAEEVDAALVEEARLKFEGAYELGKLSLIGKAQEELFGRGVVNEATRTAINGLADECRTKIKSSPSLKGAKQGELAGT